MTYGLNFILGKLPQAGEDAVTVYGLYCKIQQMIIFSAVGIRDTITPVVSFNYGMGNQKRIRSGIRCGMSICGLHFCRNLHRYPGCSPDHRMRDRVSADFSWPSGDFHPAFGVAAQQIYNRPGEYFHHLVDLYSGRNPHPPVHPGHVQAGNSQKNR